MPLRCEILSADDLLIKEAALTLPSEASFIRDYFFLETRRIIGMHCLTSDLGGLIHIVDDPELIEAINHGTDITKVFSEETTALGLLPDGEPIKVNFTLRSGRRGKIAVRHVLPPTDFILN